MKLETFPLIVAVVLGLVGLALIYDGRTPDYTFLPRERRRSPRIDRDRRGEIILGIGVLALAAAVAGRDVWRYRILAALIGGVLIAYGTIRNRHFISSMVTDRGPLRRRDRPSDPLPGKPTGARGSLATARPAPASPDPSEPGAAPPASPPPRGDAEGGSPEDPPPPIPS